MQRWMQAKMIKMAQVKIDKPDNHRRIKITSAGQLRMLRELGWRIADLDPTPVDELKSELAWFVYVNGTKCLHIR